MHLLGLVIVLLCSYPVYDSGPREEVIVSPMEMRTSSVDEPNEEELHSDVDEEDSLKHLLPRQRSKGPSPTRKSSSLTLCSHTSCNWMTPLQLSFMCILLLIQFYCLFVHGLFGFLSWLEFLPLLLTSVSCAVGVSWSWLLFYHEVLFS